MLITPIKIELDDHSYVIHANLSNEVSNKELSEVVAYRVASDYEIKNLYCDPDRDIDKIYCIEDPSGTKPRAIYKEIYKIEMQHKDDKFPSIYYNQSGGFKALIESLINRGVIKIHHRKDFDV